LNISVLQVYRASTGHTHKKPTAVFPPSCSCQES